MNDKTLSQFWLQIKPAYIIENFENLISYLQSYKYDSVTPENNSDYDATVDTMIAMAEDYAAKILKSPIELPGFDISNELLIRLLAATILAAKKRNESANRIVIALVSALLRINEKLNDNDYEKLAGIIFNSVKGYKINFTGYKFQMLESQNYSLDLFSLHLTYMTFYIPAKDSSVYCVENHGVAVLDKESILNIYPDNFLLYNTSPKIEFIKINGLINLKLPEDSYIKTSSFKTLYQSTNEIVRSLSSIKAAPKRLMKDYSRRDEFLVEVMVRKNSFVLARTIDSSYNLIEGKVNLQPRHSKNRISKTMIQNRIKEGDLIRVSFDENDEFTFKIADTLESFYQHVAVEYSGATAAAVFENHYPEGYTFVTEEGVRVSIYKQNTEKYSQLQLDALDAAINGHLPVDIKFFDAKCKPNDPKFILYGSIDYDGIIYDSEEDYFDVGMADANMLEEFMEDCLDESLTINRYRTEDIVEVDSIEFSPILSIMVNFQRNGFNSSRARLEYATAGRILAEILGSEEAVKYFENERKITNSLVDFAQGNMQFKSLPSDVDGSSEENTLMQVLRGYVDVTDTNDNDKDDLVGKIRKLVDASNSLHDILGEQELFAIKRVITRILGVEDELVVNSDNRTFYGVENEILEFKSSIVYPPANRRKLQSAVADPGLQKWAIIRTVCGFLNSRSGGDLLLGVRDTGYPVGIGDDIRALASRGLIPFESSDAYRTYVQLQLDAAFNVENAPKTQSGSITRSTVTYTIDTNIEGLDILHIKVMPYKQGVVRINKTPDRPSNMEDIYIRLSGRTVSVTPEMRPILERNKN